MGNAYDPKETALAHYIWVFYVSKIYEFVDTFIMLLKNNLKQVCDVSVSERERERERVCQLRVRRPCIPRGGK